MSVLSRLLPRSDRSRTSALTIEPMTRRMLADVMPIEQGAYPKPWSRTVFEGELDQVRTGARYYVVARRGRELVGYAGLWFVADPDGDQAHVTNIVVAPAGRREGVGTRLMVELARAAVQRGCTAWTLEVRASNSAAQGLYRRFGFVPAGVRTRYYENTEDAIVMWCHELDSPDYLSRMLALTDRGAT